MQKPFNYVISLCMDGAVRTKEKCPKCGGKFKGNPLTCPKCLTTPNRYYLDFPRRGQRLKLYSGQDGHPLDSWERAHRLLENMRAKVDDGVFDIREYVKAEHNSLRFEAYAGAWLNRQARRHKLGDISLSYLGVITRRVRTYLIPFFGKSSIGDIQEGQIQDFRLCLPEHLKASSVREILSTLRTILKDAYARRDIGRIPAFPTVRVEETLVRWLTPEEQKLVLTHTKSHVIRALFLFLMKQGCRPSEALALRWENVDLINGIAFIRAAMDRGQYRPHTKNRTERKVKLHPEVADTLRNLPTRFAKEFVFGKREGNPLTESAVRYCWRRACKRAGIVGCTLYQGTKHSLASQAVNEGVPLEIIAKALGHRNSRSTQRYPKVEGEPIDKLW